MPQEYQTVMQSQHHLGIYRPVIDNQRMTNAPDIRKQLADRFRARLAELIETRFDGVQRAFLAATGMNQGELSGLLRDKSFGVVKARNIETKAGLLTNSLSWNIGSPFFPSDVPAGLLIPTSEFEDGDDSQQISALENTFLKRTDSLITIPQFNAGGAMGTGVDLPDLPGIIQTLQVSAEWLERNVRAYTAKANLCIVTGFGDSMRPLFNPGDPLLLDRGITTVELDAVFFFRIGKEGFIKRLQRIPGNGLIAISENKAYREWTITPDMDFEVFGRILKAWRSEDL